jgi:undecaprenyl-diphosphatase
MPRPANSGKLPAKRTWASVIPVSLGLAIASLLLFSWLADRIIVRGLDRFDGAVRLGIHNRAAPWLTSLMEFVTNLGDWQVVLTVTLCLLFVFLYRKDFGHVWLLLVTMSGAGMLDGVLKLAFHRARPDPFFGLKPSTYSFPSGHALISLCLYGLIGGLLSLHLEKSWQRVVVWCCAGVLIGLIGMSRVYLGVHWPSDVLAGYAAAVIWMGAVRQLALRIEARHSDR